MLIENLTTAKNQLSRLIDQVRHGERVRILVHGVPAADLVQPIGIGDEHPSDVSGLAQLERDGIICRPLRKLDIHAFDEDVSAPGLPLSQLVSDERNER